MAVQRQYTCKIFNQDGITFLKSFTTQRPEGSTTNFLNAIPSFESRINSGFGECVLDVALPFSDFDEGNSINFMNIVRIYASTLDGTTQTDTLIYTGFISKYAPYFDGQSNEGVQVTLLGLVSLTTFAYMGGGGTISKTNMDPSDIGKSIIDDVNSVFGGLLLSYSSDSVDTVGTNVSVDFVDQRWSDALTTVEQLAGSSWWWKIDEAGLYWLKPMPSTATHTFVVGLTVDSINAPKDSEKVINDVIIRWGSPTSTSTYTDSSSQATYGTGGPATGKRATIITDSSLADQNAADQRGHKAIADNKDAKTKATITVNMNYNLESIHVGDTCSIKNINDTFFSENLLIVAVRYKGDTVEMDLDDFPADVGMELSAFIADSVA